MAVYKPSNCVPFSNTIDLTENQDITCEINTSNMEVTGYRMKIMDSQNNVILEGKNFTSLQDQTLEKYNNDGLNGSELSVPLVVTNPANSNENNVYFSGYNWKEIKITDGSKSDYMNKNSYYHPYIKITPETLGPSEFKLYDMYTKKVTWSDPITKSSDLNLNSAILKEYYYNDYYTELAVNPGSSFSYLKYYYLDENGSMTLYGSDSGKIFENIPILYQKQNNFSLVPEEDIGKITDKEKFCKHIYSIVDRPTWNGSNTYYYLNYENNVLEMKDTTSEIGSYSGKYYTDNGYQNNTNSVSYNDIYNYIIYEKYELITVSDKDKFSVFKKEYIYVGNLNEDFYNNNIFELFKKKVSYYPVLDSEFSYKEAISGQYFFKSNEYKPLTYEDCEFNPSGVSPYEYYTHDETDSYFVLDKSITEWSESKSESEYFYYLDYEEVKKPPYVSNAIESGYYYRDEQPFDPRNPYVLITSQNTNQYRYNRLSKIYKLNYELNESKGTDDKRLGYIPYFYKKLSNFHNGYQYQPYTWQITLCQGDVATSSQNEPTEPKWYDMVVTNGKVLGTTKKRLHGILSEEIYRDYFVQLCSDIYDVDTVPSFSDTDSNSYNTEFIKNFVGKSRVRITSYDRSFGYVYPQDGYIEDANINDAEYFQIYKYTNDPNAVSPYRQVDFATTKNIDDITYGGKKPSDRLHKESDFSEYYIQVYPGKITELDAKNYGAGSDAGSLTTSSKILFKNQGDYVYTTEGDKKEGNAALNGVFSFAGLSTVGENTTIRWIRSPIANSITSFINNAFYVLTGKYAGLNFESNAKVGNALDSTDLDFTLEKPVVIYPQLNVEESNKFNDESFYKKYKDFYPDRNADKKKTKSWKYFSPLLKNTETRTFIRPFVGLVDGMRFQYDNNPQNYFKIKYVDSFDKDRGGLWYIEQDSPQHAVVDAPTMPFTPDQVNYQITTYFKSSDINPFYGYKKPYINIDLMNWTGLYDDYGNYTVFNRYALVNLYYHQENNKSWKYYQWGAYNETQDLQLYEGEPNYSGSFQTKIVGLENNNMYKINLFIEDELGYTQNITKGVVVHTDISGNLLNLSYNFNCELQTNDLSFVENGTIYPSPLSNNLFVYKENTNNEQQNIPTRKILKKPSAKLLLATSDSADNTTETDVLYPGLNILSDEYVITGNESAIITYDKVTLGSFDDAVPITTPDTNQLSLTSEHILNPYFEGRIIDVSTPFSSRNDLSMTIGVNSGVDTINSNGEIVANPDRNKLTAGLQVFNKNSIVPVSGVNEFGITIIDGENVSTDGKFRDINNVAFSLVSPNFVTPNNSYDYLYTTCYYGADGLWDGEKYTLANRGFDPFSPNGELNNKFSYLFNSTQSENVTIEANGATINNFPLSTPTSSVSSNTGVWYDELMESIIRPDNNEHMLVTNRSPSYWQDFVDNGGTTPLYWNDTNSLYEFYVQKDINENQNYSGRQVLGNKKMTFSISVKNYENQATDESSSEQNPIEFNSNTCFCFIEEINNNL